MEKQGIENTSGRCVWVIYERDREYARHINDLPIGTVIASTKEEAEKEFIRQGGISMSGPWAVKKSKENYE